MKKCMRKCFAIYLILAVLMSMMLVGTGAAWAQNEGGGRRAHACK